MAPQIFKATYSGVPVYEMISDGVSVMRRRADGWLNATQILKVAGFDKPQRTRVLEREVQKGLHEKVQGGYGKYQGTWVPPDIALTIARQFGVEPQLRPIIDYKPSECESPPPAPKHTTASTSLAPPVPKNRKRSSTPYSTSRGPTRRRSIESTVSKLESSSQSRSTAIADTPSPAISSKSFSDDDNVTHHSPSHVASSPRRTKQEPALDPDEAFADSMLDYFLGVDIEVPEVLINPPATLNPDIEIDSDGHTALHWAASMGRIRVIKLLLSAGADPFKVNNIGQTPLMRSVLFANNYAYRKFAEIYELLHRTTLNVDKHNRTVFHHIVDLAMSKGRTRAARYYMEAALARLADFPKALADIINFQDEDGETALTMAARCRSKRLVKALLDHGSDPKLKNNENKSAEDYILEDERFRTSPTIATSTVLPPYSNEDSLFIDDNPVTNTSISQPVQNTADGVTGSPSSSHRMTIRAARDEFALRYDTWTRSIENNLDITEKDLAKAKIILAGLEGEIEERDREITALKAKINPSGIAEESQILDERKAYLKQLDAEMKIRMMKRSRLGWHKWLSDEKEREEVIWKTGRAYRESISTLPAEILKGKRRQDDISDLAELYRHVSTPLGFKPGDLQLQDISKAPDELRTEVDVLRRKTAALIGEYAQAQAESGTSSKIADYMRLIRLSLPGVVEEELNGIVTELLQTLEAS